MKNVEHDTQLTGAKLVDLLVQVDGLTNESENRMSISEVFEENYVSNTQLSDRLGVLEKEQEKN